MSPSPAESDSSDTDVEELLKQEKERRKEENARKRAQLEARKQAAMEAAAAQKNIEARKPENETKKDQEVEDVHASDTTIVAGKEDPGNQKEYIEEDTSSHTANGLPSEESAESDTEHGGKEASSVDGAFKYNPEKSVVVSPDMPPPKVIPTRYISICTVHYIGTFIKKSVVPIQGCSEFLIDRHLYLSFNKFQ